jgi:hypothetical protein
MKNYEDSKCTWGYITLCDPCAEELKERDPRLMGYNHIHIHIEVQGFPLELNCEKCGKRELKK